MLVADRLYFSLCGLLNFPSATAVPAAFSSSRLRSARQLATDLAELLLRYNFRLRLAEAELDRQTVI